MHLSPVALLVVMVISLVAEVAFLVWARSPSRAPALARRRRRAR